MGNIIKSFAETGDVASTQVGNDRISDTVSLVTPNIINAFWCNFNKKQISVVDYGDVVYIYGETKNLTPLSEIQISIWESISDDLINQIHVFSVTINLNGSFFSSLSLSDSWFKKTKTLNSLFFNIHFLDGKVKKHKGFPINFNDRLKISIVNQVPVILRSRGWELAALCQDIWFDGLANDNPEKSKPIIALIKMAWVLKFENARMLYDEIFEEQLFSEPLWKNERAQTEIVKNIKLMLNDRLCTLPTSNNPVTDFGTFSLQIDKTTNKPLINKYYYQHKPHALTNNLNVFFNEFTEFLATIGQCTFYISAKGKIIKLTDGFEIQITTLGIFLKDGFGFSGNQFLGFWNPKTNYLGLNPSLGYSVNNALYQDYRARNGKGCDYYNYSDVLEVPVNFSFNTTF